VGCGNNVFNNIVVDMCTASVGTVRQISELLLTSRGGEQRKVKTTKKN